MSTQYIVTKGKFGKLRKALKISLLIITTMLFANCSKEVATPTSPQNTYIDFNSDCYHYIFKKGTYWIYMEEKSKQLDSVFIQSTSDETYNQPCPNGGKNGNTKEHAWIMHSIGTFSSKNKAFDMKIIGHGFVVSSDSFNDGEFVQYTIIGNARSGYEWSQYFINQSWENKVLATIDTSINNNSFKEVVKIQVSGLCKSGCGLFMADGIYYFAPNFGLVRRENPDGNWNLIRQHIIQ